MKQQRAALGFLAAALLWAAPALADVYVLIEEDGTPRFSNAPDNPRYTIYLRESGKTMSGPSLDRLLSDRPYQADVLQAAKTYKIDPALLHAVIAAESNYNPRAVSKKGAVGLMQVMPATAHRYGVKTRDLTQPAANIRAGARYLADLIRMFEGDLQLALAGYNAGEHVVVRYGNRIPPYAETQAYVPRVLRYYAELKK